MKCAAENVRTRTIADSNSPIALICAGKIFRMLGEGEQRADNPRFMSCGYGSSLRYSRLDGDACSGLPGVLSAGWA